MKKSIIFIISMLLAFPAFAKEAGFYVNDISARTVKGADRLLNDLIDNNDDHDVCYSGDFQSALDNVHDSISIAVNDVYGESEFPPLDVDVTGQDGRSAYGIIPACGE